ncbi:hypothetical protein JKF63_04849 [Porcisia hertigi]|uniref:Trypanosoma Tc-38 (p38) protein domain-containing protein n=1 Tax=Porcisia hertigi TaxID=2761500 RepID=A0A836LHY2_9TRYP|nr:hypothetical protein JKF63_04849 [Porcisia hertigi]
MLRCTCLGLVVFTQGFPALERFAQQHFLPSNPFSSSCLWLDEDDFRNAQRTACALNVPNPLRIDPYAHHPRLSRFAPAQARRAVDQNTEWGAKDTAPKAHNGTTAAKTVSAYGASPETPNAAGAEACGQLRAAASDGAATLGASMGPAPMGGVSDISPRLSTEEATLSPCQKGRQSGNTAKRAKHGGQTHLAEDLSNYQAPICTLILTKPLYVLNMDQMYLSEGDGTSMSPLAVECLGREGVVDSNDQHSCPLTMWSSQHLGFTGGEGQLAPTVSPSLSRDGLVSMPSERDSLTWSQQQHIADGMRALQLHFPNPISDGVNRRENRRMYSISTRRPYAPQREHALNTLVHRHGYSSHWWGTHGQWKRIGAMPQPGQAEHVVPISVVSKVVHISLIENAEAVLRRSVILAKSRKLLLVHPPSLAQCGGPESGGDVMEAHAVANVHRGERLPLRSDTGRHHHYNGASRIEKILLHALDDMQVQKWSLPVYFSLRQLRRLGLELRPDTAGFRPTVSEAAGVGDGCDTAESEHGGQAKEGGGGMMDASDRGAATTERAPAATDNPGASSPQLWGSSTPPLAAATNTSIQNTTTPGRSSPGGFEYWYHISQVYFPDSYLVPSAVLTAEFESPGVPLNGISGRRLLYPALLYESLINQHPEVAESARCASATDALPHTGDTASDKLSGLPDVHGGEADASALVSRREGLPCEHQSVAPPCASSAALMADSPGTKVDEEDVAISRFVATHASPKHTQGRSLWYQAEDVLAAGGVVDVNSAPVEVMVRSDAHWVRQSEIGGSGLSGYSERGEPPGNVFYNVECLTDPDKALRLLSQPFDPV